MPKGHAPKRESKKPKKKKQDTNEIISSPVFGSTEVEVVKKKRKPRNEDF